ncbi:radical SAM family heme chaperone HemW [Mucilaginibacter sp.]
MPAVRYFCCVAGIYIHIPFCRQACHYCDFHFSTSLKYRTDLVEALTHELKLQRNYLNNEPIETIYFGGGTPSLLESSEISLLTDTIAHFYHVAADAEITLEANPDDLTLAKINQLRQTPVNRLSIGIQSFFDEDLQWMNRAHRSQQALDAVKQAQDAGFGNMTADLIYGYPLLTDEKWHYNLQQFLSLHIPHLSAYSMTVEPQTALDTFIRRQQQPAMNEQQSAAQFNYLMQQMQQEGYEHYEISNFCRPGLYSRHNSNYWKGVNYLGIGPSAHSFNGHSRQWNIANNALYLQSISNNQLLAESEELTTENRLNEYIMTSLRTQWGTSLQQLDSLLSGAGTIALNTAKTYLNKGWLSYNNNCLYLTPAGKLYADKIAAELFF